MRSKLVKTQYPCNDSKGIYLVGELFKNGKHFLDCNLVPDNKIFINKVLNDQRVHKVGAS
jgi:hypothetical protein